MLFYFPKGKNAAQIKKEICFVYGEDTIDTVRKWFRRLRNGNFNLDDEKHSGRPSEVDDYET